MVSKELASITFIHFYIFSIHVNPFKNLFHGEVHMDDGNMPKKFPQILVHGFQEIDLHHLQPFLVFLEIHASINFFFYGEVHNDDGNMIKKFQLNLVYRLEDIEKTRRYLVNLQDTEQHVQD